MKKKRSKFQNQTTAVTATALTIGLLLNPFSSIYGTNVQAQPIPSTEQLLANITPVQREALQKLQTTVLSGFHSDEGVNTESEELNSVILVFNQKCRTTDYMGQTIEDIKADLGI